MRVGRRQRYIEWEAGVASALTIITNCELIHARPGRASGDSSLRWLARDRRHGGVCFRIQAVFPRAAAAPPRDGSISQRYAQWRIGPPKSRDMRFDVPTT